MTYYNLISFLGIIFVLFVAWIFSPEHKRINWHVVFWGTFLQFLFALFIFRFPAGIGLFNLLNSLVIKVFSFAREGIYFLFGPLAVPPGETGPGGEKSLGFILAVQALPTVIFFSSLMSLLYHWKIMPKLVEFFARVFTKLMRVSGAEALCTASNIFVGIESIFTIRPYIEKLTLSEICTILTAGMATIASTVLGLYVSFLHNLFPTIAGHLISASILSAPATLVVSKLIFPEKDKPLTLGRVIEPGYEKSSSWIEAIIRGANEGVKLYVGIMALLLAFLGLLALFNGVMKELGILLGKIWGGEWDLSLPRILSFLFRPFVFFLGVPREDIGMVSQILGERVVLTELFSYRHLAELIREGKIVYLRSVVISAYALCGFAHIASLAIFTGGLSALTPKRAKDIARLGLRALFSATLACLMTAAVAGIFFPEGKTILLLSK
ncbi:MAG: nucleoside transporter [Candidatus Omnitrophica bacterium]|nr:nucleoside transporter [Candidatus Omnitrophota bacterium]MCM8793422.1 nucleoside transporter [Candidatus Omnitrophota bacterium]